MDKKVDYDSIGGLFETFTDKAAQREIEIRTIAHMLGSVSGKSVLDLACGYGYFGRQAYYNGAKKVVGVDISTKMIKLARQESLKNSENIEYYVRDVSKMEVIGKFDVVIAAWLFNYAASLQEMRDMFRVIFSHLRKGGRLIAYTVEPDFRLEKGNFERYGVNVLDEIPCESGFLHHAEFVTTPPSKFTFYRWNRKEYEEAILNSGFSSFRWQKPLLMNCDIRKYSTGFWDIFKENCLQTGLVCEK